MFHLEPSLLEKILRPLAIYLFLLIAIRVGGQREIAQNNALQFVLLLSVANAVQNGIIGIDNSVSGAIVGAVTLFVANGIVEILTSRNSKIHSLVIGRPVELMTHGRVNRQVLRRQRLSEDDLLQAAARAGVSRLIDVDHMTLASDGQIDVSLKVNSQLADEVARLSAQVAQLIAQLDKG